MSVPGPGNARYPGAFTALRRAVEQRLHWAAEAAALNALTGVLAPWELIQQPAQTGVLPLTAAAAACTGWKMLTSLPRGYRWLAEHHPLEVEVRLSLGRRQKD
ncbi:hypothetical protein APR11_004756 [Nocardia amikacinitolerans]|uniref:hypothetical protein n=1 Tax=Nocardia amikacinitolerans TaxID=756689 RepID=UPI0020A242FA|nr:hypothetical protein [Nocardia amikacinitolerans]MCP2298311.1 hypothetical protein [Nocardia amikacinitolerans]